MLESVNVNDLDFVYGYMIFKAYFFKVKTKVEGVDYPNSDYAERWRRFCRERDFLSLIRRAVELISNEPVTDCLNFYDCLDRSSYFALIHRDHPNITLGFIKDADLWDLWLNEGIFNFAREKIAELLSISNGDRIIDFGCGSASPVFYGSIVGPNGYYLGIDFSKPLLNFASLRVKERRLDWVHLKQELADSKLRIEGNFDYAICSSILQYADYRAVLRNAVNALKGNGTIMIFSEVFSDLEPEKAELFDLYYSLIPNYRGFPRMSAILEFLEKCCEFRYKLIGRNFLRIDVKDVI